MSLIQVHHLSLFLFLFQFDDRISEPVNQFKQEYGLNLNLSAMKDLNQYHLAGKVFANLEIILTPAFIAIEKSLVPVGSLMDYLLNMENH